MPGKMDSTQHKIWTISNLLTMIRILLIPFFFWACLYRFHFHRQEEWSVYGFLSVTLFVLIVVSDFADGYLARKLGQTSSLGAFLDPLADKLMVTASFVLLAALDQIPAWLTIGVVSRDLILFFGWCLLFVLQMDTEIRPWMIGKVTALFQFAAIGAAIIAMPVLAQQIIWTTALALTLISAVCYIYEGLRRSSPKTRAVLNHKEKESAKRSA